MLDMIVIQSFPNHFFSDLIASFCCGQVISIFFDRTNHAIDGRKQNYPRKTHGTRPRTRCDKKPLASN